MDDEQVDGDPVGAIPDAIREDMLELVAIAGGSLWGREGLDPDARSMVTLAILTALGRTDELRQHVRLAVEDFGLTPEQVGEVILHCSVYAGFPAALEGFRVANEELTALDPVPA